MNDLKFSLFGNHELHSIDPSSAAAASTASLEAASNLLLLEGSNNLQVAAVSSDGSSDEDDVPPPLPAPLPNIADGQDPSAEQGEAFDVVNPEDVSAAVDCADSERKWRGKRPKGDWRACMRCTGWTSPKSVNANFPPFKDKEWYGQCQVPQFVLDQYQSDVSKVEGGMGRRCLTPKRQKEKKAELAATEKAQKKQQAQQLKAQKKRLRQRRTKSGMRLGASLNQRGRGRFAINRSLPSTCNRLRCTGTVSRTCFPILYLLFSGGKCILKKSSNC
jgi:hypothetical protein